MSMPKIEPVKLPLRITDDFISVVDSEGQTIAAMDSEAAPSVSRPETLKYAVMFSAAPEMLEALQLAEIALLLEKHTEDSSAIMKIRAAIYKAKEAHE